VLVVIAIVFPTFLGGPGGRSQGTIFDALGIDDHVGGLGLEGSELDVGGGGAQGAQEQSGGAVIDLFDHEHAHDFGEAELDRVWVFERGDSDDAGLKKLKVNFPTPDDALLVEVATSFVAQGGRSALGAVDFDVLTAADGYGIGWHGFSLDRSWC